MNSCNVLLFLVTSCSYAAYELPIERVCWIEKRIGTACVELGGLIPSVWYTGRVGMTHDIYCTLLIDPNMTMARSIWTSNTTEVVIGISRMGVINGNDFVVQVSPLWKRAAKAKIGSCCQL